MRGHIKKRVELRLKRRYRSRLYKRVGRVNELKFQYISQKSIYIKNLLKKLRRRKYYSKFKTFDSFIYGSRLHEKNKSYSYLILRNLFFISKQNLYSKTNHLSFVRKIFIRQQFNLIRGEHRKIFNVLPLFQRSSFLHKNVFLYRKIKFLVKKQLSFFRVKTKLNMYLKYCKNNELLQQYSKIQILNTEINSFNTKLIRFRFKALRLINFFKRGSRSCEEFSMQTRSRQTRIQKFFN